MIIDSEEYSLHGEPYFEVTQYRCPQCGSFELMITEKNFSIRDGSSRDVIGYGTIKCIACEFEAQGSDFQIYVGTDGNLIASKQRLANLIGETKDFNREICSDFPYFSNL